MQCHQGIVYTVFESVSFYLLCTNFCIQLFRFATQSDSGLLLYNGRYNEKHDFIALEIVGGAIRFSFSLGSNVTTTVASLPGRVSDGNWHSVTVHYFNKVREITFKSLLQQMVTYNTVLTTLIFYFKYLDSDVPCVMLIIGHCAKSYHLVT